VARGGGGSGYAGGASPDPRVDAARAAPPAEARPPAGVAHGPKTDSITRGTGRG